jgi:DNA-3-methyladenine glycosylase
VAARRLLGSLLVRDDDYGRRVGRIVELEAYSGPDDRASHARAGRTARNAVMFGPPGIAYVYLVYGMYDCLNVVTGPEGTASALLIRAVEPLEGIDAMRADRARMATTRRPSVARDAAGERDRLARLPDARLASGPGLVGAAFGIDRSLTGTDLCDAASPLRLEAPTRSIPDAAIRATPRIGVAYAGEPWTSKPWRLVVAGHPSVSGPLASR